MKLRKITALFTACVIAATSLLSNTTANAAEGAWSQTGNTYSFTSVTGADAQTLNIGESSGEDWGDIRYLSVDVSVEGTAKPVLGAELSESDWTTSTYNSITNGTTTLYLHSDGEEISYPQLMLWEITAGTTVTLSNITFSTEEYTPPAGVWYEEDEGVWSYTHTDDSAAAVPYLDLSSCFAGTDWTKTNNVSLKVKVEGQAYPVFEGELRSVWSQKYKYVKNSEEILYHITDGSELKYPKLSFWKYDSTSYATAGAKITVSAVEASSEEFDYSQITGEWIKTGENDYYYRHKGADAFVWLGQVDGPSHCDISEVQSISFKSRANNSSAVMILKDESEGNITNYETTFPISATERSITRYVNGTLKNNPTFCIAWVGDGAEIFINDLTYSTLPAEPGLIEPNGLLINSDKTEVFENVSTSAESGVFNGQVAIIQSQMENIEGAGVLQLYIDKIGTGSSWCQFALNYSDGRTNYEDGDKNYTGSAWMPLPNINNEWKTTVNGEMIIEVRINEALSEDLATFIIQGENFVYHKAVFIPDPDAAAPEASDEVTDTEKNSFGSCTIKKEKDAPKHGEDFEYGKPQAHKSEIKTGPGGEKYYAQRIVQRIKKDELNGAKSITLIAHAKTKNKYVKLTVTDYYTDLNMNGSNVEAGTDDIFLTVIFDNIPENEELTFTSFKINY